MKRRRSLLVVGTPGLAETASFGLEREGAPGLIIGEGGVKS